MLMRPTRSAPASPCAMSLWFEKLPPATLHSLKELWEAFRNHWIPVSALTIWFKEKHLDIRAANYITKTGHSQFGLGDFDSGGMNADLVRLSTAIKFLKPDLVISDDERWSTVMKQFSTRSQTECFCARGRVKPKTPKISLMMRRCKRVYSWFNVNAVSAEMNSLCKRVMSDTRTLCCTRRIFEMLVV